MLFVIKVSYQITHEQRLKGVKRFLANCITPVARSLRSSYKGPLFQFPPTFAFTERNARRLKRAAIQVRKLRKALGLRFRMFAEFRHASWLTRPAMELCQQLKIVSVSVCATGRWNQLSGRCPQPSPRGSQSYLRLHGSKSKYEGWYSDAEVQRAVQAVTAPGTRRVFVAFNNTMWGDHRHRCRFHGRDKCAICNALEYERSL